MGVRLRVDHGVPSLHRGESTLSNGVRLRLGLALFQVSRKLILVPHEADNTITPRFHIPVLCDH